MEFTCSWRQHWRVSSTYRMFRSWLAKRMSSSMKGSCSMLTGSKFSFLCLLIYHLHYTFPFWYSTISVYCIPLYIISLAQLSLAWQTWKYPETSCCQNFTDLAPKLTQMTIKVNKIRRYYSPLVSLHYYKSIASTTKHTLLPNSCWSAISKMWRSFPTSLVSRWCCCWQECWPQLEWTPPLLSLLSASSSENASE